MVQAKSAGKKQKRKKKKGGGGEHFEAIIFSKVFFNEKILQKSNLLGEINRDSV